MRKYLAISVLAFTTVLPFQALAQTPTPRIGYIDLQKVMMESEKGKEVKKSLTDEFEKARKTMVQKQDELQKIKDALKDYQRLQTDYEAELRQKDQELSQKLLKELEEIVKGLGESEKYTLILERSQAGILFATPAVDATDKVISLYNESAKKKAAPKK
jgi:outer membrane protein